MVDDPLQNLLGELLQAHDRLRAAEQPAASPPIAGVGARVTNAGIRARIATAWRLRRRRSLAALSAGALVMTASAAAAVVIATQPSRPFSGPLPPELLGTRYALRVTSRPRADQARWCISLLDLRAHRMVLSGPGACVSGSGPLIARGGLIVLDPVSGHVHGELLYAIVDRRVAALQAPDGVRIRPISSRELPAGWRAAIIIQTHPVTVRGHVVTLTPLDAAGKPMHVAPGR